MYLAKCVPQAGAAIKTAIVAVDAPTSTVCEAGHSLDKASVAASTFHIFHWIETGSYNWCQMQHKEGEEVVSSNA